MTTIFQLLESLDRYGVLDESKFHGTKQTKIKAKAREIMNRIKQECQNRVEQYFQIYDDFLKENNQDIVNDESKNKIRKSPFLSFVFVVLIERLVLKNDECVVVRDLGTLGGEKINEVAYFTKINEEDKGDFNTKGRTINLYQGIRNYDNEKLLYLYQIVFDSRELEYFKIKTQNMENIIVHELQHAWYNFHKGEENDASDTNRNLISLIFPFMSEWDVYLIDDNECESRYSQAYVEWKKKNRRVSFIDLYVRKLFRKYTTQDLMNVIMKFNKNPYQNDYIKTIETVYILFVFLPQKDVFKYEIEDDEYKREYRFVAKECANMIEDSKRIVPILIKMFEIVLKNKYKIMKKLNEGTVTKIIRLYKKYLGIKDEKSDLSNVGVDKIKQLLFDRRFFKVIEGVIEKI